MLDQMIQPRKSTTKTTIGRTTTMLTDTQCFKIAKFMISVIAFAISSGAVYILGI